MKEPRLFLASSIKAGIDMSNGAKVKWKTNGKHLVYLGWGRGNVSFEVDEETGEPKNWENLSPSPDPSVNDLLISRAQAIFRKEQNVE